MTYKFAKLHLAGATSQACKSLQLNRLLQIASIILRIQVLINDDPLIALKPVYGESCYVLLNGDGLIEEYESNLKELELGDIPSSLLRGPPRT